MREQVLALRKDELSRAFVLLTGDSKSGTKELLAEELLGTVPHDRLETVVSRVEALRAFKYSWVFSLRQEAPEPLPSLELESLAEALYPGLNRRLHDLDASTDELQPTLQLHDSRRDRIYVKFTHWVLHRSLTEVDGGLLEWRENRIRHPVTALIRGDLGSLEIRFEGFQQGRGVQREARVAYDWIASKLRDVISAKAGMDIHSVSPGEARKFLANNLGSAVREVGRSTRTAHGRVDLRSDEVTGLEDAADVIRELLDMPIDVDELRAALTNAPADAVVLAWRESGLLSRIAQREGMTEIYFLWRGNRSSEGVDRVVNHFVSAVAATSRMTSAPDVRQYVEELPAGRVVLVSELVNRFSLPANLIMSVVDEARRDGLLARRFRLATDTFLEGTPNEWVADLAALPSVIETANPVALEPPMPDQVEVGFQRTRHPGQGPQARG